MNTPESSPSRWGVVAAIGAGLAASACCTIPLLLVTLGVGGAWVGTFTAMEPFRPLFIVLAVGFLGVAGYQEYRTATGPQCDCEVTMQDRLRRTLLVVGLIATLALIASPWIIRGAALRTAVPAPALIETSLQSVVLDVEGMTCAACDITVRKALTNLDGVEEATVTFEPPQAVVTYDPSKVSVEQMTEATTNVGYPSKRKVAW
ncbi:MAG: mercuric transporter MerT family protein [Rhodothermales bacterium]